MSSIVFSSSLTNADAIATAAKSKSILKVTESRSADLIDNFLSYLSNTPTTVVALGETLLLTFNVMFS
jgi:hypothetical protein